MLKYNIVITAGGTNEKIDEVRKITNMSTGALGVKITEELIKQKGNEINKIYYLCSRHAKQPKEERLLMPPFTPSKIEIIYTESVDDLLGAIENLLKSEEIHYFIHSAAISDYTTNFVSNAELLAKEIASEIREKLATKDIYDTENMQMEKLIEQIIKNPKEARIDHRSKISSKNDNLTIQLKPTEKIISKIKELSPHTFLVGFKLLNGVSEEELFNTAFNLLRKNRCNLILANDLSLIRKGEHTGMIVYPEKKHEKVVGKENIAKVLVKTMFKRGETRYPSSRRIAEENELDEELVSNFYEVGKKLYDWDFLPTVEGGTYGNMSVRLEEGIAITGRNVQKGDIHKDILVKIENVDEFSSTENQKSFAQVNYKGKVKPSIDSAIHHFIYKNTDFNAIVHVHTEKLFYNIPTTEYNYACGTEQEMLSIINILTKDKNKEIIQMTKHGLIILGYTLDDCLKKLVKLYDEALHLEPIQPIQDKEALDEWFVHFEEVKTQDSEIDFYNKDKYYVAKVGSKNVGIVYLDLQDEELTFVIYGIEKHRKSGFGLGTKVLHLLTEMAKQKNISTLKLVTVNDCGVVDYYKEKHNFIEEPTDSAMIVLKKTV